MSGGTGGFARCPFLICVSFCLVWENPKAPGSQSEMDAATMSPSHSGKGLQLEILQMINCSVGNTPFSLHSGVPGAFGDAVGLSAVCSQENTM